MDVNNRIKELADARGWTEYRLAKESDLSSSTIANIFHRNSIPSIPTLEAICKGLGVTLSQFFAETNLVELDAEQQKVFSNWRFLTNNQKFVVSEVIDSYITPDKKKLMD